MDPIQDVNSFAPTNPQNQAPGSDTPPTTNPIPKSAMPKAPEPQPTPPPQSQAPAQPQGAPQAQPAVSQGQPKFQTDENGINFIPDNGPTPNASPDNSDMKNYITKNLQNSPTEAKSFWEALDAGFQRSVSGLVSRGKEPDLEVPQNANLGYDIAQSVGQLAGDLPAIAAGTTAGAAAGPMGAMAGAFSAPMAIRKILMDHYQKGDIQDPHEFVSRLMGTAWEAIKGGVTGVATAVTGGAAGAVAGPIAGMAGELGAMTTVGSALEGHLPHLQDFVTGAIVLGGVHAVSSGTSPISEKLQNIFSSTGAKPDQVVEEAQKNPMLKQQLLSSNPNLPVEAAPTELQHFSQAEGTIPKDIVPKDGTEAPQIPEPENQWNLKPKEIGGEEPPGEPPKPPLDDDQNYFLNKIGTEPEPPGGKPLMDQFHDLYAKTLDRSAALRRILDQAGVSKSLDDSPALMQMMGASGDVTKSFIEDNTRDFNSGKPNGEPFMDVVKDYRKEFPEDPNMSGLKSFGIAARTLELAARGKEVSVNGEALDLDKAKSLVESHPEYQKYLDRIVGFKNRTLDYMHDSGFFTDDQIKAMKDLNQQHFSFKRIQDPEDLSRKGGSRSLKRIDGEGGLFQDPIVSTIKDTDMMLRMSEENRVRRAFVDDLQSSEHPEDFIEQVKPDMKPIQIDAKEIEKGLKNNGIDTSDANITEGATIFRPEQGRLNEGQFVVHINGERKVFETSPIVADALNSLSGNPPASFIASNLLKGFASFLRLGTVNNPLFAGRHIWRNERAAAVFSQTGYKPFLDLVRYAPGYIMKSEAMKNALFNKAFVSSIVPMNKDYVDGKIYSLDKEAPALNRAWNLTKTVAGFSHWAIILHDNITRFAENERALAQGKTPQEAAYLARNIIPDYQKAGIQQSALMSMTAFLKVHLTSEARTIEALRDDPMGTALKGLMYVTVPSLLLYASNQNDDRVNDQSEYMKNMYDMMAIDHWKTADPTMAAQVKAYDPRMVRQFQDGHFEINDGPILRIPTPFSLGVIFGRGATAAIDAFRQKDPKPVEAWAKDLASSFVSNALPTASVPGIEQMFNHNFFSGKNLISGIAEKNLPELEQKPYTSEVAKQLGRLIHYIPPVAGIGNGNATLDNPIVIDNYIQAWGGTLGQYAIKLVDAGLHGVGVGNTTTKPLNNWSDTPFVKEFMLRNPSFNIQAVDDFYKNFTKTGQVMDSLKEAQKSGDQATVNYIQSHYQDFMINLGGSEKALSQQTRMIRFITESKDMTALDKNQLIEKMLYGVMATAKKGNADLKAFQNSQH